MSDEWVQMRLDEVADIQMGLQLSPTRAKGPRLRPYLRAANVAPNSIDLSDVKEMSFDESEEERYALRLGDVLLVEGGNEKSLGSPALVSHHAAGLCFQNTLVRLRVKDTTVLLPEFLLLTQLQLFASGFFAQLGKGTTILHLGATRLPPTPVVVPPLSVQRRIVDLTTHLDAHIANLLVEQVTLQDASKAQVFAQLTAIQPGTTVSLDKLVQDKRIQLGRGQIISKKDMAADPGDYPVYSSARGNNGMIGQYGKYMFDEELITWSIDGGGHVFYRPRHRFSVTNIGGFLRILDVPNISYRYLSLVLQKLHGEQTFDWQNKAHPSVIRTLYSEIPLPDKQIQEEIGSLAERADSAVSSIGREVANLSQLRAALLQSLMTGATSLSDDYDSLMPKVA